MHYNRLRAHGDVSIRRRGPNGGGTTDSQGYIKYRVKGKEFYEHVLVVEKALGKKIPKGAVVHHLNGQRHNNNNNNLILCPSQSYHRLIHTRMKMLGYTYEDFK